VSEYVQIQLIDRVRVIRIHRPDKKNALTREMYTAITAAMRAADDDAAVRAVLITGLADCFTSGNDVSDFVNEPPTTTDSPVGHFLRQLTEQQKPLIAAVNGAAIGVGVTLLLHCDLVYAGAGAKFQMPFVSLGLCPEAASSLLLPAMVGRAKASELLLLGERFSAEVARDCGIVNAVLPDGETFNHALARAHQLAAQPPQAVRVAKRLLARSTQAAVRETILHEFEHFSSMLRGPEALEAMTAFLQKRAPDFSRFN
jgi:enoyl-CoA hydratase/carnithine racemase